MVQMQTASNLNMFQPDPDVTNLKICLREPLPPLVKISNFFGALKVLGYTAVHQNACGTFRDRRGR